mgnify:CR=1 FL=1
MREPRRRELGFLGLNPGGEKSELGGVAVTTNHANHTNHGSPPIRVIRGWRLTVRAKREAICSCLEPRSRRAAAGPPQHPDRESTGGDCPSLTQPIVLCSLNCPGEGVTTNDTNHTNHGPPPIRVIRVIRWRLTVRAKREALCSCLEPRSKRVTHGLREHPDRESTGGDCPSLTQPIVLCSLNRPGEGVTTNDTNHTNHGSPRIRVIRVIRGWRLVSGADIRGLSPLKRRLEFRARAF